jgi:hypothetical protein
LSNIISRSQLFAGTALPVREREDRTQAWWIDTQILYGEEVVAVGKRKQGIRNREQLTANREQRKRFVMRFELARTGNGRSWPVGDLLSGPEDGHRVLGVMRAKSRSFALLRMTRL